jgi:ribosomal protein L34
MSRNAKELISSGGEMEPSSLRRSASTGFYTRNRAMMLVCTTMRDRDKGRADLTGSSFVIQVPNCSRSLGGFSMGIYWC